MPLNVNNIPVQNVNVNGVAAKKVNVNGQEVWSSGFTAQFLIGQLSTAYGFTRGVMGSITPNLYTDGSEIVQLLGITPEAAQLVFDFNDPVVDVDIFRLTLDDTVSEDFEWNGMEYVNYSCAEFLNHMVANVGTSILLAIAPAPAPAPLVLPSAITDFNATDDEVGQVTMTWTNVPGVYSYDLYETGILVESNVASGHIHTTAVSIRDYFVRAIGSNGYTDSNTDSGTVAPPT